MPVANRTGRCYNGGMRKLPRAAIWLVSFWLLLTGSSRADDIFYNDLTETSPLGRYQVTARSPDNHSTKRGHQPVVQGRFVYTCRDTQTRKTLWTLPPPKGGKNQATLPPPLRLAVSDDGWTVIYTGTNEFIPVDLQGNPHGRARLLDAFTGDELNDHLRQTTEGLTWTTKSLWYFLTVDNTPYLLVRPWWGHRVAVDLRAGKVVEPLPAPVADAAAAAERAQTLQWLQAGADTFPSWETVDGAKQAATTNLAAYLAGKLQLAEAVPLLRRLEPTTYNSESALEYIDEAERKAHTGEVNPLTHRSYDLRRMVQLSLRRLGQTPAPLPVTVLERAGKNYHDRIVYDPPVLAGPRAGNVDQVKVGLSTEAVCQRLGPPDYIIGTRWEYDLDAQPPTHAGHRVEELAGVGRFLGDARSLARRAPSRGPGVLELRFEFLRTGRMLPAHGHRRPLARPGNAAAHCCRRAAGRRAAPAVQRVRRAALPQAAPHLRLDHHGDLHHRRGARRGGCPSSCSR